MSVSVKCILIYFFRDFSLTINIGLSDMNIKLNDKIAITENIANMLFGLIKLPFAPIIFKNISSKPINSFWVIIVNLYLTFLFNSSINISPLNSVHYITPEIAVYYNIFY